MSKWVQVVIGEFELLERHELAAPVRPGGRRVRVDVEPARHRGLCLPCYRPKRPRWKNTQKQINGEDQETIRQMTLSGSQWIVCSGRAQLRRRPACVRRRRLQKGPVCVVL